MKVAVVSLFPRYFDSPLRYAPLRKAVERGILSLKFFSPIDEAPGPKDVEDYIYGGGEGMLLKVEFFAKALQRAKEWVPEAPVVFLSPSGKPLSQEIVKALSLLPSLILAGGHYKGVDARIQRYVDMEVSIGDFVVSSGELAALVVLDAVVRLLPGVLTHIGSAETDSIHSGLLEPPLYTRPKDYRGEGVPEVLLSGHHARIDAWKREYSIRRTLLFRPDLIKKRNLSGEELEVLRSICRELEEICRREGD